MFNMLRDSLLILTQTTEWTIVHLPRRRLIIGDCKFYLTDFSLEQRVLLGIDQTPDSCINEGPNEPLAVEPYRFGRTEDEVELWLYIRDL